MNKTEFAPELLGLFDAPTPKEKAEKKSISVNLRLRFALQDARAWHSKQPRAYAALAAIFAKYKINLGTLLGTHDAAGKAIKGAEVTVPNTKDWDLSAPAWDTLLRECEQLKAAYKAMMEQAKATPAPAPTVAAPAAPVIK